MDQLKRKELESIGKIDGKEPHSHSTPPPLFAPLQMVEKCEEHIAAIKGYRIDHPNFVRLLDPILVHFEAIVDQLDRKHLQLIGKITAEEIPVFIKQVSADATAFEKELRDHKSTIICEESNYNRELRATKFVVGDLVLSKCIRKLNYVLTEVQTNPAAVKSSKVKGKIETAILKMASLRADLKKYETPTRSPLFLRNRAYDKATSKLTAAIKNVTEIDELL